MPVVVLQGKLEAIPMTEAISTLESAWSTAYKVIGSESAHIKTIDMITGEPDGDSTAHTLQPCARLAHHSTQHSSTPGSCS